MLEQGRPQVGLTCGSGRVEEWVRNFGFQWVGLGHGSEMADLPKTCRIYV